jgi:transglutaminase-like putative cysteine protease
MNNRRWSISIALFVALTLLLPALPVRAACSLQIVQAGPCLDFGTYGTPAEGDEFYGVRVTFNVVGTPSAPFNVQFVIANITNTYTINIPEGFGYSMYSGEFFYLDDPIPWTVTLDPVGTSGNTNPVNTISGVFTPIPPTNTVQFYEPLFVAGSETALLNFTNLGVGDGGYIHFFEIFGQPGSHGAQTVLSLNAPTTAVSIVTAPYNLPVLQIARTNAPTANYQDTETFTAQLNGMLVNTTNLQAATWADIAAMPTNWTQWLAPDAICESTNPLITNFVYQTLGANYQNTLNPYQAARLLHMAVMRTLTYLEPPPQHDAVGVLTNGMADCGGFSALLVASMRCAGIPARRIAGFWLGDTWPSGSQNFNTQWHVRVEFHLPAPGVQWLVADPTEGNAFDPTGSFAYDFGYVPDANNFFAVDVGDSHELSYADATALQVPNDYYFLSDAGFYYSYFEQYYLQPQGFLSVSNLSTGVLHVNLTNAPFAGSIVIESSTNLLSWSPIVTNTASGATSTLSYQFPTANPHRFFRASQVP